jgi:hypothetical protein
MMKHGSLAQIFLCLYPGMCTGVGYDDKSLRYEDGTRTVQCDTCSIIPKEQKSTLNRSSRLPYVPYDTVWRIGSHTGNIICAPNRRMNVLSKLQSFSIITNTYCAYGRL